MVANISSVVTGIPQKVSDSTQLLPFIAVSKTSRILPKLQHNPIESINLSVVILPSNILISLSTTNPSLLKLSSKSTGKPSKS